MALAAATGLAGSGAASPLHATRGPCAAAGLLVRTATARRSYPAGKPVTIRVTVRNLTRSSCWVPLGSCLPQVLITATDGTVVWNRAAIQVVCVVHGSRMLRPGTTTFAVVTWNGESCAGRDPKTCPGGPVRPGVYRATANWSSLRRGSTTFVVRPS